MRHINPIKAGTAVGLVIALWHLVWVTFVFAGWAKPFMDFVLRLHFIRLDYEIGPFALGPAAGLVAVTFGIGFLFGLVFAVVWNWLAAGHPESTMRIGGAAAQV